MSVNRLFVLGFAAALVVSFGCSSGGRDDVFTASSMACSDGGAAGADAVTLKCSGLIDDETAKVDVVLGGPAVSATTLRGLSFDVTYDPSKLSFVATESGASPLFPNALVAVSLADGEEGRVIVSIQQLGGDPDVSVAAGQHITLHLAFRRTPHLAFGPTSLALENAEAASASAVISFGSSLALSHP